MKPKQGIVSAEQLIEYIDKRFTEQKYDSRWADSSGEKLFSTGVGYATSGG